MKVSLVLQVTPFSEILIPDASHHRSIRTTASVLQNGIFSTVEQFLQPWFFPPKNSSVLRYYDQRSLVESGSARECNKNIILFTFIASRLPFSTAAAAFCLLAGPREKSAPLLRGRKNYRWVKWELGFICFTLMGWDRLFSELEHSRAILKKKVRSIFAPFLAFKK